jgi:hypothetical protein
MTVKDFLENFNGTNHIKIFDHLTLETHRHNTAESAINIFGLYPVKGWTIVENVLKITI